LFFGTETKIESELYELVFTFWNEKNCS